MEDAILAASMCVRTDLSLRTKRFRNCLSPFFSVIVVTGDYPVSGLKLVNSALVRNTPEKKNKVERRFLLTSWHKDRKLAKLITVGF